MDGDTAYQVGYVPTLIRHTPSEQAYCVPMPAENGADLKRFAALIREAREGRRWSQPDLAKKSGVSRPTIQRYENGKTAAPRPDEFRSVCAALGIDPREAVIALGYVTRDEMGLPAPTAAPALDPPVSRAARLLADPKIPDRAKQALRKGIDAAIELWFDAFGASRPPREPSAEQRAATRSTTSSRKGE